MRRIFYFIVPCIVFCFYSITSTAQSLAGSYTVTGYFFHPTLPRTENLVKKLTQINDSTYQAYLGDLDNSYNYYFQFTVNAANQLVNWRPVGSTPADSTSGFMTADNPGGFSYYPDTTHGYTSDVYNNTYDPATQTFYMHYGYNNTDGINSDTGQASYTRQIYEKWVYVQVPFYNHSDIHSGGPGTVVTLFGNYFTGATNVYFGGREASSSMVQSDSMITAIVGGGNYGAITISNINGTSLSKDDFVFIPPVVMDTLWTTLGKAGFSAGASNYVSIATDTAGLPYVVYQDKVNGNKAMVMKLGDNNTWLPVGGIASAGASSYTNIAIGTDNIPYIAYLDSANQNGITVRKFSGGAWQDVGSPNIDSFTQNSPKIALVLDSSNLPYVLGSHQSDIPGFYGFNLNKFDGTSWSKSSPDKGWDIYSKSGNANIAIDKKTNFVYLFSDNGATTSGYTAYGMKYDGRYWDTLILRLTSIPEGVTGYPDIAIDSSSALYVTYPSTPFQQMNVYKYNGQWQQLAIPSSILNHGRNTSLVLDQSATPYLLYEDYDFNSQGTVVKLTDSAGFGDWKTVGARGFAPSSYFTQNSIVISKNGVPYIAFADSRNGNKVTVMHYETYEEFMPRTEPGLYSQGDSATCTPWVSQYPDWTSYYSDDTTGKHIEMQTLFQDNSGSLCGFQGYIDSSVTGAEIGGDNVALFPRSYRISFSQSPFAHPVGIRLFATTAEVNQLLAAANASGSGADYDTGALVVYRYDGPNEDYIIGNNQPYGSATDTASSLNYTPIEATVHYYGSNNEYCYIGFYTSSFSEFHIGIPVSGVLPVHLLGLSAAAQNHIATVNWQTTNEVNTAYFTVQRSTDGVHFTNIGNVKATGTGGNHTYQYQDNISGIATANVYYRLLMTDKDGSSRQSEIVSLSLAGNKLVTIQPNPAHNYAVVTCHATGKKTITITDMNGRNVFTKITANSIETIPVSSFAKGLYLVRIEYAGGRSVQKLVVE